MAGGRCARTARFCLLPGPPSLRSLIHLLGGESLATRKVSPERPPVAAIGFVEGVDRYYRLSPARFPLPGAVVTPGTPRRLDSARKKLSGEPAGEYWIVSRATESWPQGSTGAARQPSVRP